MRAGDNGDYRLTKPVFLIGFMGSGKTSVADYLARERGLSAVDADDYLEACEGRSIASIFAEDGEGHFRDLETRYLRELAEGEPCLVSTGGGVVKRPENVAIMSERGFVVYLRTTAEESAARIPDSSSRPLFKNLETARVTLSEREPLYEAAADIRVETVGRPVEEIAQEVLSILEHAWVAMRR